jgi:fructose 1,6-bisphosphate aldolase/phosphatase
MRRHGAFEPHRLPPEELEYTTLPKVLEKLKERWEEDSQERLSEQEQREKGDVE